MTVTFTLEDLNQFSGTERYYRSSLFAKDNAKRAESTANPNQLEVITRMNNSSNNDDNDFQFMLDAWVHLTPLQKKIIVWRVFLMSLRARAFRFIDSILRRSTDE
jgi:hypothetical protein